MQPFHDKALAVVGRANTGKTTLIETLIERLCSLGLHPGVIKHASHGFHLTPKKDSTRFFDAGAKAVWVVSERMGSLMISREPKQDLKALIHELLIETDLVILEGYKGYPLPQVWVRKDPLETPLIENPFPKLIVGPFEQAPNAPPLIPDETIEGTLSWILQTLAIPTNPKADKLGLNATP
jgi:molybdopterin-guanine dinucleotide biosynthesis protein MobB